MAYAISSAATRDAHRDEIDHSDFDDRVEHNWRLLGKVRVTQSENGSTLQLGPFTLEYSGVSREVASSYIVDAESQWTTVTSGPNGETLRVQLSLSLTEDSGDFELAPCTIKVCGLAAGAAQRAGSKIFFRPHPPRGTPGHEFGHIFGLGHQREGTLSIMSSHYNRSVQYSDAKRLMDFYGE